MGTGGHNVPLILTDDDRIRKLTPRECSRLQGFPKEFKLPEIGNSHLYKQFGNSVSVPVMAKIAKEMIRVLGY
jgi:DNA (cytosine-5)-methyltransferase 1